MTTPVSIFLWPVGLDRELGIAGHHVCHLGIFKSHSVHQLSSFVGMCPVKIKKTDRKKTYEKKYPELNALGPVVFFRTHFSYPYY